MTLARAEAELERAKLQMERNVSLTSPTEIRRWKEAQARASRLEKRIALERRFNQFTDQAAALKWNGPEDFLRALHVLWWHCLEDLYCNYNTPQDLSLCGPDCRHDLEIVCLNSQMRLYGCCLHGSLHECAVRYATDPDSGRAVELQPNCACTIQTKQDDVVCMFSGSVVSRAISNVRSSSRDFQSESSSVRGMAGYSYVMTMRQRPSDNFRNVDAERERRRRAQAERQTAEDATGASTTKRKRSEPFEAKDYRGRKVREEVLQERKRYMHGLAESVMNRVLHDKARRKELNEYNETKTSDRCVRRLFNYHSTHSNDEQLPSWIECVMEFWSPLAEFRLLPLVDGTHHARRRFAVLVCQLWEICHRSPYAQRTPDQERSPISKRHSFCTLKQFALAVLFAQREGLYIKAGSRNNMRHSFYDNRIQFVPYRAHLAIELPHERELSLFSDSAQTEIQQYLRAESKVSGAGEFLQRGSSFRSKRRRARPQHRNRRVEVARDTTVSEASMLPEHWKNKFLGDMKTYAVSDVNRGRKFLVHCLNSYDVEFLHEASRSLASV